jgi:hypothetical protein
MNFGTKGCMYCDGECNKECLSQEESKQEKLEERIEYIAFLIKLNMEKTAVEFLVEKLNLHEYEDVIEEANQMFREQIIKAAQYEPFLGDLPRTEGIHYFEKTFKTK